MMIYNNFTCITTTTNKTLIPGITLLFCNEKDNSPYKLKKIFDNDSQ